MVQSSWNDHRGTRTFFEKAGELGLCILVVLQSLFAFDTISYDVVWVQWTNDVKWGKSCSKRSRDDGL